MKSNQSDFKDGQRSHLFDIVLVCTFAASIAGPTEILEPRNHQPWPNSGSVAYFCKKRQYHRNHAALEAQVMVEKSYRGEGGQFMNSVR